MMQYVNIQSREDIGNFLNEHGLIGEAAEIGCAFGGNAKAILRQWKGAKLYMVDPWVAQPTEVYRERTDGVDFDAYYESCLQLAREDARVQLVRMYSVEAAKQFADGQLDFVYIDANHSYEAVRDDMAAWFPKVKSGGVFAGHDYGDDTHWPHYCEVKKAVDEWAYAHHTPFTVGRCCSWWMIKP